MSNLLRESTRRLKVGHVEIGGGAPIAVQSMTTTDTRNVEATVAQIHRLQHAGCDIVRVAVPDLEAAAAVTEIKKRISLPVVADVHFDYRLAVAAAEAGADKLRINPGNIGSRDKVEAVAKVAKERGLPIRVGANAGSIDKSRYSEPSADALVESALEQVRILESVGFEDIVISLKAFDVPTAIEAYRRASKLTCYPLHLGITESGLPWEGAVRSAVGIGVLLEEGIGDTIRVSLTGDPVNEVTAGVEILASLGLREKAFTLICCPTCGRCGIDVESTAREVKQRLEANPPSVPLKVAVMGCSVNGPGEARMADVGIAGGTGFGVLFVKGAIVRKVSEDRIIDELMKEIEAIGGD